MKQYLLTHKLGVFLSFLAGVSLSVTAYFLNPSLFGRPTSPLPDVPLLTQVQNTVLDVAGLKDKKQVGVLLVGYGGAGHDGGFLTDAIQVLYLDFEKSNVALISIPRDLWVRLPNGREAKINATITSSATDKKNLVQSGAPAMKTVLGQITGLPIDYFIGVDFVGYQRAIGSELKGIEVSVSETLDDPWYPIEGEELNLCGKSPEEMVEVHAKYSGFELERQFECRYKHIHFDPGIHTMQGGEALEYVRSRHGSAEGDVSRGKRQQEVIAGIQKKLFSLDALKSLPGFYEAITKHTVTDVDLDVVRFLVPALEKSKDFKFTTINLSPTNVLQGSSSAAGGAILIPKEGSHKWDATQKFIAAELAK